MTEPDDDFAALFEASITTTRVQPGQAVEGTIVAIGPEVAFVDIGGKGEATIAIDELRNEDGTIEAAVGDRLQATVMSTGGGVTLSRKLQRAAASAQQIEDAFRAGLPVEGRIERVVKGGYEVRIGRQRAFCPLSQIDSVRTADPTVHEGRVYTFRIIEYGDAGRKFVVSRRALLEAEAQARAAEVRRSLAVGKVMTGRVVSVRDFGAFVDLGGGVQGLLHVSEMGWSRVADPSQVATPGEELTVQVLRIDEASQQIALGLKQLTADPWSTAASTYAVGQARQGRVTRVAEFGAFVELEPGVTGLVPIGETGLPQEADLRKALPVGTEVDVIVLDVDPAGRRIRLSCKAVAAAEEAAQVREYTAREDAGEAQSFGALADRLRDALSRRPK